MEPGGKDKEENDKDLGSPTLNNSENPEETQEDDNRRRTNKDDDGSYGGECLLRFCVSVFDCFFLQVKIKKIVKRINSKRMATSTSWMECGFRRRRSNKTSRTKTIV